MQEVKALENDDPGISSQINKDLEALEKNITKTFDRIKFEATVTAKIIKLTSRNNAKQFLALLVAAFCGGVLMTTLVYHAFINGIMNNYLHRTIRIMARTEIDEARKEADMILQNANIKADAILQGTNNYVLEKKTKGDE